MEMFKNLDWGKLHFKLCNRFIIRLNFHKLMERLIFECYFNEETCWKVQFGNSLEDKTVENIVLNHVSLDSAVEYCRDIHTNPSNSMSNARKTILIRDLPFFEGNDPEVLSNVHQKIFISRLPFE